MTFLDTLVHLCFRVAEIKCSDWIEIKKRSSSSDRGERRGEKSKKDKDRGSFLQFAADSSLTAALLHAAAAAAAVAAAGRP